MTAYVIFGATGGIGNALCTKLASGGARLAVVARNAAPLEALARATDAVPIVADATAADQVDAAVTRAAQTLGELDGVASCIGSVLLKPAHRTSDAEWLATLTQNLTTSFWIVRAGARALMARGGAITLVSSCAALVGLANHEAIAAAKAGVIGLVRAAAATYAPHAIRVNCVAPGLVRTPATTALTQGPSLDASLRLHPLGRIGEPEDVAAALAFLLAREQTWITGQVLGIDGGLATLRSR
ncbi:MAG: SDR family oxidoreductase [Kofleriaceae bacterium]|nr:SDR family oxidoreductase [Kofleriaceae bacterium]